MHRWLAQSAAFAGYPKGGFWVPKVDIDTLSCVSPCVCVPLGMQCKGPGVSWPLQPLGHGRRLTRSSLCPILCCLPRRVLLPTAHCSTELVNHLSLARAAVSTVRYLRTPQSAATLLPYRPCCPGALASPGTCACTQTAWEVEDTCKTVPLGEWREAKGVFMHRRPLQSIRPQARLFAKQIRRRPAAQSRGAIICFFVSIHFC